MRSIRYLTLLVLNLASVLGAQQSLSDEAAPQPYLTLPATPHLPRGGKSSHLKRPDGSSIWYRHYPANSKHKHHDSVPITFLHGGFANSDYWGLQMREYVGKHPVLTIDSRGHGRSVEAADQPITYTTMTDDVVAVLDHLAIDHTAVVGWSDGGIIGLDMAQRYPSRLDRLFAFGASYSYSNINTTIEDNVIFNRYLNRTQHEYRRLNPHPDHLSAFEEKMNTMWATLPDWNSQTFANVSSTRVGDPLIWIVDGADEEAVNRTVPAELHDWISGSALAILPLTSHFAFMQDPVTFNAMLRRFLEWPSL